jgi:hypothetical protein
VTPFRGLLYGYLLAAAFWAALGLYLWAILLLT